jgi:hypothetical protein
VKGILREECEKLNEDYRHWTTKKEPWVILKLAMTMDGYLVVPGRRWVTGEHARAEVQKLRAGCDAILVGAETLRKDNPKLTVRKTLRHSAECRNVGGEQPWRVVVTRSGKLPKGAKYNVLAPMAQSEKGEYYAEFQKWIKKGFVKAKEIKLYPESTDKSSIDAVVHYETYSCEVMFERSSSEAYDMISKFFRSYVLAEFFGRKTLNIPVHLLSAFASVADNNVYVAPVKEGTTTMFLTDTTTNRFMVIFPLQDDHLFLETEFRQAADDFSSISLVQSLEEFEEALKKYAATLDEAPKKGSPELF